MLQPLALLLSLQPLAPQLLLSLQPFAPQLLLLLQLFALQLLLSLQSLALQLLLLLQLLALQLLLPLQLFGLCFCRLGGSRGLGRRLNGRDILALDFMEHHLQAGLRCRW